jgi:hypothetical protein
VPSLLADVLLFLAGLYFFLATRHNIRLTVLSLCFSRRLRWRVAHGRRRNAGAGREGTRHRGARDPGALGDVLRIHESPAVTGLPHSHFAPPTEQGWTFPATPS